ncbi:HAD-IA family hydrolase [uncultured Tateyamaria sp.]|uniref:HAD-IA family hydrolase n=1 Tax=Tateyamaria sp. 1078 TaxID=3417464 RepID=UPI0026278386|nr:HAD-IA family hydrolase [uncultured Tateyamaria sp.]
MTLRLVIFDMDGTLVDSQADILSCMAQAFAAQGLATPPRGAVLGIVGLSLPQAMYRLAPQADQSRLVQDYKAAFAAQRLAKTHRSVLYPGALQAVASLHGEPDILLAVATGKSRRGLDALLAEHDMTSYFVSTQVADTHPSKPHPSMILTALADTGVDAADAVMVGDTTYDRDMAQSAGVSFVGVTWGYHDAATLGDRVIHDFGALRPALAHVWRETA